MSAGLAALGLAWVVRAVWEIPSALGAGVSTIAPTASGSLNYRDRRFHNTEPTHMFDVTATPSLLPGLFNRLRAGNPRGPIPMATPLAPADAGELALTWYGHATTLLEIDGHRVLTDPMWSERCSPSTLVGPARLHPVPVPLTALPQVDAVVISHDHYDHLDRATVGTLIETQQAPFLVPTGVGAHLRRWNVPKHRIVELGWGESARVGELTLTCTEARHFSGRGLLRNPTLWASWAIAGPRRRAFFGGDTGYTKAFAGIGADVGPFDLTLLPIGAYGDQWADIHMNPEEAVRAHLDLSGGVLVPIHWATFNLALHGWSEPVERMLRAASVAGVAPMVPMPGQRLDVSRPGGTEPWWREV